jgi:hypothetical protein
MTSPDVMCQVVDVSASYTGFFVLFVIAVVISAFFRSCGCGRRKMILARPG